MPSDMQRKIFISYSHVQKDWVHNRLRPCIEASGAEVLIDADRFKVGHQIHRQMDTLQDQADISLLVLSPDYLASDACQHEMKRAISKDPGFTGRTIPVKRVDCDLPGELKAGTLKSPLQVDLRDDGTPRPWDDLFRVYHGDLGTEAPHWLEARDDLLRMLRRDESVNLVVQGHPKWRELVNHLGCECGYHQVDLDDAHTFLQPGLLAELLRSSHVSSKPRTQDLVAFQDELNRRTSITRAALLHLDRIADKGRKYENGLFSTLRYTISDLRKLTLLMVSRRPAIELVPKELRDSPWPWQSVELKGRS